MQSDASIVYNTAMPYQKSQIRLLAVDDNQEFIDRLLARLVKIEPSIEFICDSANSGEEALKKVEENLPDIILLDNMLADEDSGHSYINAADVYKELLRRGFLGIPVIVVTYDTQVHGVKGLEKMGIKGVFNKDDLFCDVDGHGKLMEMIKRAVA